MAFIKAQKVIRDENGISIIGSSSAAIVDTVYMSTGQKSHSKYTDLYIGCLSRNGNPRRIWRCLFSPGFG